MYRIAILGCENSHANAFLSAVLEEKVVEDIEFVGVFSEDAEAARKLHDRFGVYVAEGYDEFVGKIDGLIITARHGENHYKYAKPYIASGIPMFIDKPITHSEEDAGEFMEALKAHHVPVCGGSMVTFSPGMDKLREALQSGEYGKVIGGYVRMPINKCNPYGNFHFYSQHAVQCMLEIFGMHPRSVQVFEKGITYTCVVRYDDFDVTVFYAENHAVYYEGIHFENKFLGMELSLEGCANREFMEFYELLTAHEQRVSYEDLFAPVYVINAMDRAIKSGKEALITEWRG